MHLHIHMWETLVDMSDPLLDMSDPSYSNGHMIMISPLVVFLPVALHGLTSFDSNNLYVNWSQQICKIFQNGIFLYAFQLQYEKKPHCSSNDIYSWFYFHFSE